MRTKKLPLLLAFFISLFCTSLFAQTDWIRTGTGLGQERIRIAVPDFRPTGGESANNELLKTFNEVLFNDLNNAGIFDVVSKSFYPLQVPGTPQEMRLDAWAAPPPNASMVAFGNLGKQADDVVMQGWLFDAKNQQSPQVLGKQYREQATVENARIIAHRFANEIIFRLGGGINGIFESQIVFISNRSGNKEVWMMDWDGANQRQLTKAGSIALSPRISPDGSRVAYTMIGRRGVVAGWDEAGVLVVDARRSGDLCRGRERRQSAAADGVQRIGRVAGVEPEDGIADRVRQRAHGAAADLHHGKRRHERAADDRWRVCGVALVVAEWPVPDLCLAAQLWPGSAGGPRHLHYGHCQQAVGTTDP